MRRYPCRLVLVLATVSSVSLSFSPRTHYIHALSSSRFIKTHSNFRFDKPLLQMGMKVTVRIVGKKSSGWLDEGYSMYQKRLRSAGVDLQTTWHRSDQALVKGVQADHDKGAFVVLLDPKGNTCASEKLAVDIYKWMEIGGSRLVFVIGGAEGLPEELRSGLALPREKPTLLSLSELTFTHQFARLVLIEQVYRAAEIRKGTGYHK